MSIVNEVEKLRTSSAESINNSEPVQIPEAMGVGDMLPQGDIGLLMLKELPAGAQETDVWQGGNFQLAPGTNQGSRHCIPAKYKDAVKVYSIQDGNQLSDLCLEAKEAFDVVHPEHADHLGYPAGIYRVLHQQNAQNERVRD